MKRLKLISGMLACLLAVGLAQGKGADAFYDTMLKIPPNTWLLGNSDYEVCLNGMVFGELCIAQDKVQAYVEQGEIHLGETVKLRDYVSDVLGNGRRIEDVRVSPSGGLIVFVKVPPGQQ